MDRRNIVCEGDDRSARWHGQEHGRKNAGHANQKWDEE